MELQFVNSKRTNKAIIVLYDIDDIDIDLLKDRYIVGADKGAYLLLKKGIVPDIAIGDFDSCNDDEKKYVFDNIKNIIKLNPIKDKSDTKECIEYLKDYDDIIVYGGINAPYIWLKVIDGLTSWEFFDKLLNEANVVGTPGVGFGPSGEGYFRLTSFGTKENTLEAINRIKNL